MKIEAICWPKSQPLAEQYISGFDQVSRLFDFGPSDWNERVEWMDKERQGVDRGMLADVLAAFNGRLNAAPETMANIERLRDERTLVIAGGQQTGLFSGPLLVIYKAISVLQAAREASEKLKRPVVPVFWIAGEDHDFDEVNHTYIGSAQGTVEKIQLGHPTGIRTSISRLSIPDWSEALQQLESLLPDTEFKPQLVGKLHDFAARSKTLVDFFGFLMTDLFGRYGLVLLDSDDPGVRKLEAPMFSRIVDANEAVREAVRAGIANVEALGFKPQADTAADSTNLFVFREDGERVLLLVGEDGYSDRKKQIRLSREELLDLVETAPERLSNNVMTRPSMQDYVLPVLGVVLGPGEIAYWSQLKGVFHALGMRMPVIIPRQEYTLLEGTQQKHMAKYDLTFEDVLLRFEERKLEWLRAQDELHLEERFDEALERFKDMYKPLIEDIAKLNAGLQKLGETNIQKIAEQIGFLKAKSIDARQSQQESAVRQLDRIRLALAPIGKLQERVYNVFAYLNKFGDTWLHELAATPYEADGKHRIVHL